MSKRTAVSAVPAGAIPVANFRTAANGSFSNEATIPGDAVPGPYLFIAEGRDENGLEVTVEVRFDVVAGTIAGSTTPTTSAGGGGGGNLPWTGSDPTAFIAAGAGALVVGRLLYEVRSRRSDSDGTQTPS